MIELLTTKHIKKIYMDVCTLCRPFDNQNLIRIRLETDAVFLIYEHIQNKDYSLIKSPAHIIEISESRDENEKVKIMSFLETYGKEYLYDFLKAKERAEMLCKNKLGPADAAHIAFAEQSSDVFITCDDLLIKKCMKIKVNLLIMNPIQFCLYEELK